MRQMELKHLNKNSKLIFTILFILSFTKPSHQYASWFIERRSCLVDIRDVDEVIMHSHIIPVHQSRYRDEIVIDVFDFEKGKYIQPSSIDENGRRIFLIPPQENNGVYTKKFRLDLRAPQQLVDSNLQYVMDILTPSSLNEEEEEGDIYPSAIFTNKGRKGCDNLRGYGLAGGDGLNLIINIPSELHNHEGKHEIDVVAGWATGHEPVSLTHSVVFLFESKMINSNIDKEEL